MIIFFFLTLFSKSELINNYTILSQKAKLLDDSKYRITRVIPSKFPTSGKVLAEIHITPSFSGSCYCRFNDIIVPANGESDGTVVCESPKHSAGPGFVFFSPDSTSWSQGFPITFYMQTKTLMIIILIIGGTGVATLLMFWWQMRQCSHESRRNKEKMNTYNRMNYDDDEDFQPLKRKSTNIL